VHFRAEVDLSEGTNRCNCLDAARQAAAHLHYRFCRTCGIRAFARGDVPALGGVFYAVNVATLDDADPDELAASIKYLDGRHDRYDRRPEDTRLL
jgi:hypothetical protein